MSDYKILHKRELGVDTWEVFHKGSPLAYYHPNVKNLWGELETNPYKSLENAKKIIEAHKDFTQWMEEEKKRDVTEWLDDQGNAITNPVQKMMVIPIDPRPPHKLVMRVVYAVVAIILLLTLKLIFT
ncbi:TPA: hypothetical protein QCH88_004466 [Enterobacter asburiae]|nr:hypothetical protein [Enterobacter asburiae]